MAEEGNIFLVGGRAQLASGSQIDSRQPIRDDPADFCLHQSLSRSEEWWLAVKELIDVLLKDAGDSAWALIWGPKTSFAYKGDGSFSRRRLATTFGSEATADLMKHQSGELKGFDGPAWWHRPGRR